MGTHFGNVYYNRDVSGTVSEGILKKIRTFYGVSSIIEAIRFQYELFSFITLLRVQNKPLKVQKTLLNKHKNRPTISTWMYDKVLLGPMHKVWAVYVSKTLPTCMENEARQ